MENLYDTFHSKHLLVIRGLPGMGKSTLGEILEKLGAYHAEADKYFISNGEYKFDPAMLPKVHQWCQEEVENYMTHNVPLIVVTNTFTRNKEIKPYIELAKKHGYRYSVLKLETGHSLSALAERNIHQVPLETLENMARRWEDFHD